MIVHSVHSVHPISVKFLREGENVKGLRKRCSSVHSVHIYHEGEGVKAFF